MSESSEVWVYTTMDLLRTGQPAINLRIYLSWRVGDPYVVQMRVAAGRADVPDVVWLLSRELLAEGLTCEAGWGDVRILPDPVQEGQVLLRLGAMPGQQGWCRLTAYELQDFLTDTYRRVPLGHELLHIPLDAELAELLAGGGATP